MCEDIHHGIESVVACGRHPFCFLRKEEEGGEEGEEEEEEEEEKEEEEEEEEEEEKEEEEEEGEEEKGKEGGEGRRGRGEEEKEVFKDDIQTYGYMYVSTHLYLQLW